jgi:hypothetical protein
MKFRRDDMRLSGRLRNVKYLNDEEFKAAQEEDPNISQDTFLLPVLKSLPTIHKSIKDRSYNGQRKNNRKTIFQCLKDNLYYHRISTSCCTSGTRRVTVKNQEHHIIMEINIRNVITNTSMTEVFRLGVTDNNTYMLICRIDKTIIYKTLHRKLLKA